jgi:hypothetical protein
MDFCCAISGLYKLAKLSFLFSVTVFTWKKLWEGWELARIRIPMKRVMQREGEKRG